MTTFEDLIEEEIIDDKKGFARLFGMGFSGNQISKIVDKEPYVLSISEEELRDRLTYLCLRDFKMKENVAEMIAKEPSILKSSVDDLYSKCTLLTKLGYNNKDINRIIAHAPVVLTLTISDLTIKIKDIMKLGYTKSEVILITKRYPEIFNLSIEEIEERINELVNLGYSKDQAITMTKVMPKLFGIKLFIIENALTVLAREGFTKEELAEMTSKYPEIFARPLAEVCDKIRFYKNLRLRKYIVKVPYGLFSEDRLVYARYMAMKKMGVKIDENNLSMLYVENASFKKHFGYSREELLKMYPIKEDNKVKTLKK